MGNANRSANSVSNWEFVTMFLSWQHEIERTLKDKCNATLLHFWVLIVIITHNDTSVRQIANRLELKYTTVAEAVVALEQQGALVKKQCDDDRRVMAISITDKGMHLFHAWDAALIGLAIRAWGDIEIEKKKQTLYPFYIMGKGVNKSRESDGIVRGDTAFFIACAQIASDFQRICDARLASPAQAISLMLLNERKILQPKDIALLMAKPPSSISKLLRGIRESGLVSFEDGPSKRETTVQLTSKGRDEAQVLELQAGEMLHRHFGEDQHALESMRHTARRLIEKLRANTGR